MAAYFCKKLNIISKLKSIVAAMPITQMVNFECACPSPASGSARAICRSAQRTQSGEIFAGVMRGAGQW